MLEFNPRLLLFPAFGVEQLTAATRFHPAGSSRPARLSSFTLFPGFRFFSSSFHIRGTIRNVLLSRGRSGARSFHAPLALACCHAGRLRKVVQTPRWARPCSLSHGLTPQTLPLPRPPRLITLLKVSRCWWRSGRCCSGAASVEQKS